MKQSEAKDFLPIIKAWSEGKTLQIWGFEDQEWMDCTIEPHFDLKPKHYRIKPEPRVASGWAVFPKDGGTPYVLNNSDWVNTKDYKYVAFTISEDE